MTTPDINFVQHRKFTLKVAKPTQELLHQIGLTLSGTALIAAIAGYGALMLGRDVPTALALGTAGSVGLAANTRLREG
jgi:hypothetical protein